MEHPLKELIESREREAGYRARRDLYWRHYFGSALIYLSALPCLAILCFLSDQATLGMGCLAAFAGAYGVGTVVAAALARRRALRAGSESQAEEGVLAQY